MNTTEINGKEYTLTEGEGGKLTLTPLIKQPEPRTPEAGDVLETPSGNEWLVDDRGSATNVCCNGEANWQLGKRLTTTIEGDYSYANKPWKNLGKFSEVYVKISDVRDALSFKDSDGDNVLERPSSGLDECKQSIYVTQPAASKVREALRNLGIIAE